MRHILLHIHWFKNAGSTFDSILESNFASAHGAVEGDDGPDGLLSSKSLGDYLENRPMLKAVSSHQASMPFPNVPEVAIHPVVFLRDPLDRIGSVFLHHAHSPSSNHHPSDIMARAGGLHTFVAAKPVVISNFQVRRLVDPSRTFAVAMTAADLELAKNRLESIPTFGLVERFDDTMRLLTHYFTPIFARFDTNHNVEHQSKGRGGSLEERVSYLRTTLGNALFDMIAEENRFDIELYRFAQSLFATRLSALGLDMESSGQIGR